MKLKIVVNEDRDYVEAMRQRLVENEGYCPCTLVKTPDTKCMCKEFREQGIEGYCHCGLYYKKKK